MTDVLTAIDDALDTGVAADDDPLTRELQELALMLPGDSAPSAAGEGDTAAVLPPAGRSFAPGRSDRKIERSVALKLETPVDQMARVAAKDRLRAARAERRSLLRRLEVAATDEEAEAIRRRLDLVAGEINGLRAQLRDLRLRTDYSVVTVTLAAREGDSGAGGGGSRGGALGGGRAHPRTGSPLDERRAGALHGAVGDLRARERRPLRGWRLPALRGLR